jgi:PAB-dependent poly(A)-specific ribonuclease subunit 3
MPCLTACPPGRPPAGPPVQILLLSRDEASMLVVSYADVKRCIQSSYAELRVRGAGAGAMQRSRSKPDLAAARQGEKGGPGSAAGLY